MKEYQAQLPVQFIKQEKQFIAYTPALDISTVGATQKQARDRFEELVQVFFEDIMERGVENEVLSELGWTKRRTTSWQPPVAVSESVSVKIPVSA